MNLPRIRSLQFCLSPLFPILTVALSLTACTQAAPPTTSTAQPLTQTPATAPNNAQQPPGQLVNPQSANPQSANPQPAAPAATNVVELNPPQSGFLTSEQSGSKINIRSQPNTTSNSPHYGFAGDTVSVLKTAQGNDGTWYFVEFQGSGAQGWVRGDFLQMGTANNTAASSPVVPQGVSQEIQFAPGTSGANLTNSVVSGSQDEYYLSATPGQTMTVSVEATESNAVFQIYGEVEGSWTPLMGAEPGQDATYWSEVLPSGGTGRFKIVVGPTRGNAQYSLSVGVE